MSDSPASIAIDRISPTRRPPERHIGYQTWSTLLFVHWRLPLEQLQPLVHERLTIDTFDGDAWVGLVPFHMSGVHPRWFPPIPGVSSFHETNLRTYVHLDGKDPGVWFFSLDASNWLAVRVACWKWNLPYYRSTMQVERHDRRVRYHSQRRWPETSAAGLTIEAEFGDWIIPPNSDRPRGQAVPETLEHFLAERYILYTRSAKGRLSRGQVDHQPYPLHQARLIRLDETLLEAANIRPTSGPEHVMFSEGFDVDIFPLRPI